MRKFIIAILLSSAAFAQTAKFPGAIAADKDLTVQRDKAQSTLTGAVTSSATSFTVVTGSKFVAGMILSIENEQVLTCSVVGNTVNVGYSICPNIDGRGYAGTSAVSHSNGLLVSNNVVAWNHNSITAEVKAIETALGPNLSSAIPNPLPINKGGTNAQDAATARANLGTAKSGANSDITALSGLTTPLPIAEGGTGATTQAAALAAIMGGSQLGVANGGTGAPSLTGVVVGAGTSALTGVAGTPGQVLRAKLNSLTTSYEFASPNLYTAADYNFPAQTPGGSISIGSNSITLAPCPLGVLGTATTSKLYLSAGTGTAEAAIITGGTCTSGASSGTIIITAANTHSGAWTVTSASGGLQEALNVAALAGAGVVAASGASPCTIHGQVTVPVGVRLGIDGKSAGVFSIIRAADYPNGDLLLVPIGAFMALSNLGIENQTAAAQTSGAALHWSISSPTSTSTYVHGGYVGYLYSEASIGHQVNTLFYSSYAGTFAGILIQAIGGVVTSDLHFTGGMVYNVAGTYCVRLTGMDSFMMTQFTLGFSANQFSIAPEAGAYVSNVTLSNSELDTSRGSGITVYTLNGVGSPVSDLTFIGNKILGEGTVASRYGIDIGLDAPLQASVTNVQIADNLIARWGYFGIGVSTFVGGASFGTISGNVLWANNTDNTAGGGGIWMYGANGWTVTGNSIGAGNQYYGVVISVSSFNTAIVGNSFITNVTAPIQLNVVATGLVIGHNQGIDDVIPAIASAATLNLAYSPDFTITGTTGVSVVSNQWAGRRGTFITTSGAVVFTSGASIGNTCTTTSNKPYTYFSDGTKFWIAGSGC